MRNYYGPPRNELYLLHQLESKVVTLRQLLATTLCNAMMPDTALAIDD